MTHLHYWYKTLILHQVHILTEEVLLLTEQIFEWIVHNFIYSEKQQLPPSNRENLEHGAEPLILGLCPKQQLKKSHAFFHFSFEMKQKSILKNTHRSLSLKISNKISIVCTHLISLSKTSDASCNNVIYNSLKLHRFFTWRKLNIASICNLTAATEHTLTPWYSSKHTRPQTLKLLMLYTPRCHWACKKHLEKTAHDGERKLQSQAN